MNKRLNSIMLIDDNNDDNFYHKRIIKKSNVTDSVIVMDSGFKALEYLKTTSFEKTGPPDLIFLDINMPRMNGWEFLEEYDKLDDKIKSKVIITMLSTTRNPDDIKKAKELNSLPIKDFISKPLTIKLLLEIVEKHF